jgi:diguanylate cyclase (GGDEF)-like protein
VRSVATDWSAQQLAEFLAVVAESAERDVAIEQALVRVAETFDAEVVAFLSNGNVLCSVGYGAAGPDEADLLAVAASRASDLNIPGAGRHPAVVVVVDEEATPPTSLVLGRAGEAFTRAEVALQQAMARVLAMTLRLIDTVESERHARSEAEERRRLLERLSRIQQSISARAPLGEVLDAITAGAAALLDDDVVGLRLVDATDPDYMVMVSCRGFSHELQAELHRRPVGEGVGGQAIVQERLVLSSDYAHQPGMYRQFQKFGLVTAMAAPVFENGNVVGSLVVGSTKPGRVYSENEQEILVTFADHVSLALNDARTVQAMNHAFDQAMHQALHDALTGLPNRALFVDRLEHALARRGRSGKGAAVLFIDLDNFKTINDCYGHAHGDALLASVTSLLLGCLRSGDTAARFGGDEFAILIEEGGDLETAAGVADRLLDTFDQPLELVGDEVTVRASIGIAVAGPKDTAADVLRNADMAMYRAKSAGKARFAVFEPAMHMALMTRVELEGDLRRAIDSGDVEVHYQPVIDLLSGETRGFEALARWRHRKRGQISPTEFIPLAEEAGLIGRLGAFVLGEACREVRDCQVRSGYPVGVTVNVSGAQLQTGDAVAEVKKALEESGLAPESLTLEITESVLMQDTAATIEKLWALKKLGVHLAIDDFGTGYSSLGYLRHFPIDVLKVDKSFVDALAARSGDGTLVHAIVQLGHTLGLVVVAEGIEHEEQVHRLLEMGCVLGQGYFFSPPVKGSHLVTMAGSARMPSPGGAAAN